MIRNLFAFAVCALLLACPALAQTAAAPAPDAASIFAPLWNAALTTGFLGYVLTWAAALVPQATSGSSPAWIAARWLLDLIAANVRNAANAPAKS